MRVLHIYRTYFPDPPGGLPEAIRQISLSTKDLGVENKVFTLSPNPIPVEIERPEGLVVRAKSWWAPASCDIGLFSTFKLYEQQARWADILHFHFPWPFADLLEFTTLNSMPKVMTYHSDIIEKGFLGTAYNLFLKRMLKNMDAVVATSPAYVESSFALNSFVDPHKTHVIPLGISPASYRQSINDAELIHVQKQFNLKENSYFLFIGAFRPYKGIHYLIDAARKTGLEVVIVGSGALLENYKKMSRGLDNVHLLGQVCDAEKMALIRDCKALVLPSIMRSEAFGVVLLEAMMMGKPLISTELSTGTSYVNEHLRTGMVVTPKSVEELASAMKSLDNNILLSSTMGCNAKKRFDNLFSGSHQGQSYLKLYEKLIHG